MIWLHKSTAGDSTCPWDGCTEDVDSLHLLQVHAGSHSSEATQPQSEAMPGSEASLVSQAKVGTMKAMFPYYHTSSELREQARELAQGCNNNMKMNTVSEGGVDIDVIGIRAPNANPINRVFLLFGEHSRELISPESALRFLQLVCGKVDAGSTVDIASLLQDSEFQIVLNGNPRSRSRVEGGEFCLRTNPNGVDLNRNWDEHWQEHDATGQETNPGARPWSEAETRIFKELVTKFQPTTFLTIHSGTKGMYMPWAYDTEHAAQYNAPGMLSLLKELDSRHCQCPFGAAGKEVGYPCPGTCLDWIYSKLKTPYVFAFEIYTNRDDDLLERWNELKSDGDLSLLQTSSHLGHKHFAELFSEFSSDFVQTRQADSKALAKRQHDCFENYNPSTEAVYNKTVQNWAVTYLEMAARVAKDLKTKK